MSGPASTMPPAVRRELERLVRESLLDAAGTDATVEFDRTLDLPLVSQVKLLVEWATSVNPRFVRSIPPKPTDHDILITKVIEKMARVIAASDWPEEA